MLKHLLPGAVGLSEMPWLASGIRESLVHGFNQTLQDLQSLEIPESVKSANDAWELINANEPPYLLQAIDSC